LTIRLRADSQQRCPPSFVFRLAEQEFWHNAIMMNAFADNAGGRRPAGIKVGERRTRMPQDIEFHLPFPARVSPDDDHNR
jgi:hypothetical protein